MSQTNPNNLSDKDVIEIASQAYTYGFPLVMMHLTKEVQTNVERSTAGHAPINQFGKAQTFPTYLTQDVVKPNVDTFYNIVWFDLSEQQFVVNIPYTEQSTYDPTGPAGPRYTLFPFLDAYSNVFASFGTRKTGEKPQLLFVCGPDCNAPTPDNMTRVQAPTNMVWLLGRIQAKDDIDGAKVVWPLEQQLSVTPYDSSLDDPVTDPLNPWNNPAFEPRKNKVKTLPAATPLAWAAQLSITEFFNLMSVLMKENSPPSQDQDIVASMQEIGIDISRPFELDNFTDKAQYALGKIPTIVPPTWETKTLPKLVANGEFPNNWINFRTNIGRFGADYTQRALIAHMGLGANIPIDAMYPVCLLDSNNKNLKAGQSYTLNFSEQPPNNAFWSLTCYNSEDYLVQPEAETGPGSQEDPIYSVGSRSGTLQIADDGGFTIYVQPTPPTDPSLINNWLPSPSATADPDGTISLTLRLYWPGNDAVTGIWSPPSVTCTSD